VAETPSNHILRRLRKQLGLSQPELEAIAGVSLYYIGRMELGRHCPSLRTIRRLAHGLHAAGLDMDEQDIVCLLVREWECT